MTGRHSQCLRYFFQGFGNTNATFVANVNADDIGNANAVANASLSDNKMYKRGPIFTASSSVISEMEAYLKTDNWENFLTFDCFEVKVCETFLNLVQ